MDDLVSKKIGRDTRNNDFKKKYWAGCYSINLSQTKLNNQCGYKQGEPYNHDDKNKVAIKNIARRLQVKN